MIFITQNLTIAESEVQFRFKRASGPGGQNVNKVSSAVELRFDICASALAPAIKTRLYTLARNRINSEGVLVIDAQRFRTQAHNRRDALARLTELLAAAATPPTQRIATRPSGAARLSRMEDKRRLSRMKQIRRSPAFED